MEELYKKHRPSIFKELQGQTEAVKMLMDKVKKKNVPHSILFTGPSGCGKTTLARILKKKLGCSDHDFMEINCADFRGIDMVRDIRSRMSLAPMMGTCRIWLIDEAHQLNNPAQNAFLKMLEDTPPHVYFFLATTDPQKLIKTIRTRCTEVRTRSLLPAEITKLTVDIARKEHFKVSSDVVDAIVENCEGSARKALVLLDSVRGIKNEEEQLELIQKSDSKIQAFELARALMNPRVQWSEIAKIIKTIDEEPETLRHMVLSYATSVMLGGGKNVNRAFLIVDAFGGNFYDSKRAGLVAACYDVVLGK